tara:strand:- start:320 stop:943 length:624 start_codon:yes stop_codon:yes gene_type:complete
MTYTKKDYVEAITLHLRDQGKRLTNLNKASMEQLQKMSIQYDVDMELCVRHRKQQLKEKKQEQKRFQEERKAIEEAEYELSKRDNAIYNGFKKNNTFPFEAIQQKWINMKHMEELVYSEQNKDQLLKEQKELQNHTRVMADMLGGEVESDGLMSVHGMKVSLGLTWVPTKKSWFYSQNMYCERDFINKMKSMLPRLIKRKKLVRVDL